MTARYEGKRIIELLPDGRSVRLVDDLAFYDSADLCWPVPAGTICDGASIPRIFWSIVGGPFEGSYRDASIIHDWYCDTRSRTWQSTHRMFFEACLAAGVDHAKAKTLYLAVYWRGPRWEIGATPAPVPQFLSADASAGDQSVHHFYDDFVRRLPSLRRMRAEARGAKSIPAPAEPLPEHEQQKRLAEAMPVVAHPDTSLDDIERMADTLSC